MTSWLKARLGRMRVSTVVLVVAFIALFWVYHNFEPRPAAPETPPTAVVPPGFVPDPNYTWVPRTNVRRPDGARAHHYDDHYDRNDEPDRNDDPTETTSPTSPTEPTPATTVVDPDGPGPLPPVTLPVLIPPALPGLGPTPTPTTTPAG